MLLEVGKDKETRWEEVQDLQLRGVDSVGEEEEDTKGKSD